MVAINATAVYEARSGGSNNNGGGFDSAISGAGTDYSLQDSYRLYLTDLACVTGTATLTSVNGGFTDAMVGNAINIRSGTNFTVGIYYVTAYTNPNTITLHTTPVGASNGSGGTGNLGGAWGAPVATTWAYLVAGNRVWYKSGTYTVPGNITSCGTATGILPIIIEGYKTTRGDSPIGDDRPLFSEGAAGVYVSPFCQIKNIRATSNGNNGTLGAQGSGSASFINCKAVNSSASAWKNAFYTNYGNGLFIGCEGKSTNGTAFGTTGKAHIDCRAYDSPYGFNMSNYANTLCGCTVTGCTVGFNCGSGCTVVLIGNVSYNNTTHFQADAVKAIAGYGNIFHTGTTGIFDITSGNSPVGFLYNCFYNITNNTNNYSALDTITNLINVDPKFVNPANLDFTLQASSPCLNAMMDLTQIGLVGAYKRNIGIDQDDNVSVGNAVSFIRMT